MFESWFGPSKAKLRAEIKRLTLERDKAQSQLVAFEKNKEKNEMQIHVEMIMRTLEMDTRKKEEQRRKEEEEKQLLQREERMREREERRIQLQHAMEERHKKELEQTRLKLLMLFTSDDPTTKEAIIAYKNRAMQLALIDVLALKDGVKKDGL